MSRPTYEELENRVIELEKVEVEHKRTVEVLTIEQNTRRILMELLPDPIAVKDTDGKYSDCNNAAIEILSNVTGQKDLKKSDVLGKTDHDFLSRDLADKFKEQEQSIISGDLSQINTKVINSEKSLYSLNSKIPFADSKGNIIGLMCVNLNITGSRRAKDALEKEHNIYLTLINTLPDPIYVKDTEGRFVIGNESCIKQLSKVSGQNNLTLKDIIGKTDHDFLPKELADELWDREKEIILKNKPQINEIRPDKHNSKFSQNTKIPFVDPKGKTEGLVCINHDITKRKQIEMELRRKQLLNEQLLDSLPHAAMLISKDRKVLAANKIAIDVGTKIGGYCWKEFGKCASLSPSNRKLAEKNPDAKDIKCTFCKADKCLNYNELINDPEVQAFYKIWDTYWIALDKDTYLHYAIDVTERRQAEEKLKKSEEKYRSLTNNLNMGIYRSSFGDVNKFIEVNPAMCKIFGYSSKEDLLAENISDIYENPEDKEKFNRNILKDGFVKNEEIVFKRKDGTTFTGIDNCITVKNGDGKVIYYDGIVDDITERKKAEAEILIQKTYFEELLQSSPEAVVLHDLNGKVEIINRKFTEMFGHTIDDIKGKMIDSLIIPENLYEEADSNSKKLARGIEIEIETKRKHKSGNTVDVSVLGSPIVIENRQIGTYCIYRDISERKRGEDEKEKLIADLQKTLEEVKTLQGLIPICAKCKKIRNDKGYWEQIESYISHRTEAEFSHSICKTCAKELYPDIDLDKIYKNEKK